jgi:hypothetical protein
MPKSPARQKSEAAKLNGLTSGPEKDDYGVDGEVLRVRKTLTGGIGFLLGPDGKPNPLYGMRKTHTIKPAPGPLTGSASASTDTWQLCCASQVKFNAVRIGYLHAGGNGATVGTIGIVAATDDAGTRDFTSLTDANFKKIATPKNGGTSYNSVKTDGTAGWRQITWSGAASVGIADPGAGKTSLTWSDLIQVEGTVDSNGLYPLLVRMYHGSGAYTRIGALTGMQTGTNYKDDVPKNYCVSVARSGDNVTTPGNWADANSLSTGGAPPLLIEFYSGEDVINVVTIGDSRFSVSSELSATKQYLSFEAMLFNALVTAGRPVSMVLGGISGAASSVFQPLAMTEFNAGYQPSVAIYLAYSINDGSPTTALAALAKARLLEFVNKCKAVGALPLLVTAFPKTGGFTAGELAILSDIKTLCAQLSPVVFDPLTVYGDANGDWISGVNQDGNHMKQASYSDMASRISALI